MLKETDIAESQDGYQQLCIDTSDGPALVKQRQATEERGGGVSEAAVSGAEGGHCDVKRTGLPAFFQTRRPPENNKQLKAGSSWHWPLNAADHYPIYGSQAYQLMMEQVSPACNGVYGLKLHLNSMVQKHLGFRT